MIDVVNRLGALALGVSAMRDGKLAEETCVDGANEILRLRKALSCSESRASTMAPVVEAAKQWRSARIFALNETSAQTINDLADAEAELSKRVREMEESP